MSWFSSILDTVVDFASGDVGGALIDLGGDIAGAVIAGQANTSAADRIAEGQRAYADSIRAGNAAAQERYDTTIGQTQGATDYLRSVVAHDPYTLTPEQKTGREDNLRTARGNLAVSGLRGAGRSGVAAINESDRRFTDRATSSNISRADAAASQLSGRGFDAANRAAGADLSTGGRAGSTEPGAADAEASADVANAALKGSVVGSLASYIANDNKDRSRESKYKSFKQETV